MLNYSVLIGYFDMFYEGIGIGWFLSLQVVFHK